MNGKIVIICMACTALSACATGIPQRQFEKPVPVSAITRQIKCEIAKAITELKESKTLNISGWTIGGTMVSQVLTKSDNEAKIETASLVQIGSNASVGFDFSGNYNVSRTSTVTANFVISSQAVNTDVCRQPAGDIERVEGLGIYDWLIAYSTIAEGEPIMGITKLDFSLIYGVLRSGSVGTTVQIIPIKATARAALSRDDTQTLTLVFDPGEVARKKAAAYVRSTRTPGIVRDSEGGIVIQNVGPDVKFIPAM